MSVSLTLSRIPHIATKAVVLLIVVAPLAATGLAVRLLW